MEGLNRPHDARFAGSHGSASGSLGACAILEQRSSDLTQVETKRSEQESKRFWTRPWLVAAIVVIVLGVGVVLSTQMRSSQVAEVPTIPLTGAEGDRQASEEFKAVEAAFHAFNTGDPVWVEVRHRGSAEELSLEDHASGVLAIQAAHDMGSRIDVSGCYLRGHGDWNEVTDPGVPTPSGYYFICEAAETTSLWDMAGIQISTTYHWVVDNREVLAVLSKEDELRGVHSWRHSKSGWMKPIQKSPPT